MARRHLLGLSVSHLTSDGRRSRKRGDTTRAERDAARRERAPPARPAAAPAPSRPGCSATTGRPLRGAASRCRELIIFIGIVVIVWGFLSGGEDGAGERVAAGLLIASLGGGELALREHLAGYRSHSTLLAGVATFVAVTALALGRAR